MVWVQTRSLVLSSAEKILVPYANDDSYRSALMKVLETEKPDLVHFQNDLEIFHASLLRDEILATGTKLFMLTTCYRYMRP